MKTNFQILGLLLALLLFSGCSKISNLLDEDDSEITTENIISKWNFEKSIIQEIPGETETFIAKDGEWIEFKNDSIGNIRSWSDDDKNFEIIQFTWKAQENKLFIKSNGVYDEYTINKLTENDLVFSNEGIYEDSLTQTIKWKETYYLKK